MKIFKEGMLGLVHLEDIVKTILDSSTLCKPSEHFLILK